MSKKEEVADDEMSVTAVAQAADNPISTAASSKSEEVLANIKNLSLDDDVAMRVEGEAPFVGHVEFFDFDALSAVEPSSAVPHILIGSEHEEPTYSRSVDPIDDCKDELLIKSEDKSIPGVASSPLQPNINQAAATYADFAPAATGRPIFDHVATYLAAAKATTRASGSQQLPDDPLELFGDDAGNKVANLKNYFVPRPAKILKFGIRRFVIDRERGQQVTTLHFK